MTRPTPLVLAVATVASLVFSDPHSVRAQEADGANPAAAGEKPPVQTDAAAPADPEKEKRELQQQQEDAVRLLPVVQAKSIREVVRFRVDGNDLDLQTTLPPTGNRSKVAIDGFPGIVVAHAVGNQPGDGQPYTPEQFVLIHHDFSKPGEVVAITNVGLTPGHLSIARDADRGAESVSVNVIQSGQYLDVANSEKIRLYITVTDEKTGANRVSLKLAALDVVDLRRKFPAETATYLDPIFRDLGQGAALFNVNPRAGWQVLAGAYKPTDELSGKVAALVKQLDADDPKARDAAAAELEQLGQPAALVLMQQTGHANLSEEQTGRIDAFLAPYKPLPEDEAERSRTDVEFLLLTLAADDDPLRRAALEQLRTVTNKPVEFDLKADGQARHDAVSKLREQLLGATTRPATNPAQAREAGTPQVER